MTTIRRAGRALITAVAMFLAVFLAIEYAAANSLRSNAGSDRSAVRATAVADAAPLRVAQPNPVPLHPGDENCEGRRIGPAPASAPAPIGKPGCVCDCDVPFAGNSTAITKPTIKHHSVPVSRSGELAIALQTFRC